MAIEQNKGVREIPPTFLLIAGLLVAGVLGFVGWRLFAPPPDPMAGMTLEQKVESLKQAQKNLHPRNANPGGLLHRQPLRTPGAGQ